jgi:hypothetical protein
MKRTTTHFKSMAGALKELKKLIRDSAELCSGRPPKLYEAVNFGSRNSTWRSSQPTRAPRSLCGYGADTPRVQPIREKSVSHGLA